MLPYSLTYPPDHLTILASEGRWARVNVASRNGVVDVDQDTGVSSAVGAWEGDKVPGRRAAATSDLDLSAGEVELRAAPLASGVDGNVLVAHEVLAGGDALGDLDVVVGGGCRREDC